MKALAFHWSDNFYFYFEEALFAAPSAFKRIPPNDVEAFVAICLDVTAFTGPSIRPIVIW
jgi:hypothetical protein